MGLLRLILTVFPTMFGPPGQLADIAAATGEKAFTVAALTDQGGVGSLDLHCFPGQVHPGGTFNGTPGFFHIDDGLLGPISDFATMRTTEGNLEHYISWTKQETGSDPALFVHIFPDGVCGGGQRFKAIIAGGYSGSNTFPVGLASGTDRATGPTQIITAGWATSRFSAAFFKNIPGAPYPNQSLTFAGQSRIAADDHPVRFPIFGGADPTAGPLPEDGSWYLTYENFNPPEHRVQKWWGDEGPGTLQFDSLIATTPPPPFADFRGSERATFGSGGKLDGNYFFISGGVAYEFEINVSLFRIEPVTDFALLEDLANRQNAVLSEDRFGALLEDGQIAVQDRTGLLLDSFKAFHGPPMTRATTWDQAGPADVIKLEDTHVFNSNFYLTGVYSAVGGFQLEGGGSQGFANAELIRDAFEFGKSRPGPYDTRTGADAGVEQVTGCLPDDTTDCVNGGRFRVRAYYKTPDGTRGAVSLRTLTDDTGYGFIFDPANIELVYKVLRACGINNQFWVFAAGLTDLAIDIEVFDILLGKLNVYSNPPRPFALKTDIAATFCERPTAAAWSPSFENADPAADLLALDQVLRGVSDISPLPGGIAGHPIADAASSTAPCVAGPTTLCLNQDRYEVTVSWRSTSASGAGQAVELTADTGYNWFFDPANVELLVKVLDGCAINNRRWVFAAGLTNIEVTIDVRDTVNGKTQRYQNPQGNNFVAIADTGTFEC